MALIKTGCSKSEIEEEKFMRFGERLRQLRQKHSLSGYKLGILTDRPRQFISNIENGHRPPPDVFLLKLAQIEILNVSYDELKAWALEDKYTHSQVKLARDNYEIDNNDQCFKIPLITNCLDEDIINTRNWVYTNQKVSIDSFAVKISDNGMAPKIEQTDIIIIEPVHKQQKIQSNSIYIIKDQSNSFISRIISSHQNKFLLIPINYKQYKPETYDKNSHEIMGKPLEVIKYNNFTVTDFELEALKEICEFSQKS